MNPQSKKLNVTVLGWSEGGSPPIKQYRITSVDIDNEGNKTVTSGPKGGEQTKGSVDNLIDSLNLEDGNNPKNFSEDDIRKYFETQFKEMQKPEPPPTSPSGGGGGGGGTTQPQTPSTPSGGPTRPEPPPKPESDSETEPTKAECDCIDCFDEYSKKIKAVIGNVQKVLLNRNVSIPGCAEADSDAKDPRCIDTGSIAPIQPSDMAPELRFGKIKDMVKKYLQDIGLICGEDPPPPGCDGYTEDTNDQPISGSIDLTLTTPPKSLGRLSWYKTRITLNTRFIPQGFKVPQKRKIEVQGCEGLQKELKKSSEPGVYHDGLPLAHQNTNENFLIAFTSLNPGFNAADMADRCCKAYLEASLSQGAGNDIFGPPVPAGGRFGNFSGKDPGPGTDWASDLIGAQPPCSVGRQQYAAFEQSLACCFKLDCPDFVCRESANNLTKTNTIIKEFTKLGSDSGCVGKLRNNLNQISEKIVSLLLKTYFGEFLGSVDGGKAFNPLDSFSPDHDKAWASVESCSEKLKKGIGLPKDKTKSTVEYLNLCEMGYTPEMLNHSSKPLKLCKFPIHFKIPFNDDRLKVGGNEPNNILDRYRKLIEQIKRYLTSKLKNDLEEFLNVTVENSKEWCDVFKELKRTRQRDLSEYEASVAKKRSEILELQKELTKLENQKVRRKVRKYDEEGYPILPKEEEITGKDPADKGECRRLRARYEELKVQAKRLEDEFKENQEEGQKAQKELDELRKRIKALTSSRDRLNLMPNPREKFKTLEKYCGCNPGALQTNPDGTKYCAGLCLYREANGISVDFKFVATPNEALAYLKSELDTATKREGELKAKKTAYQQILDRINKDLRSVKNAMLDILKEMKIKCVEFTEDLGDEPESEIDLTAEQKTKPFDYVDDSDVWSDLGGGSSTSSRDSDFDAQIDLIKQLIEDLKNLILEEQNIITNVESDIARIEDQISMYCEDADTGKTLSPLNCLLDCINKKIDQLKGSDLGMSLGPYTDHSDNDKPSPDDDPCADDNRTKLPASGPGSEREGIPGIEPGIEIFDEISPNKLRTSIIRIINLCVGVETDKPIEDPKVKQRCALIINRKALLTQKLQAYQKEQTTLSQTPDKDPADIAKEAEDKRKECLETVYVPSLTRAQKEQEKSGVEPTLLPGQRKIERIKADKQGQYDEFLQNLRTNREIQLRKQKVLLQIRSIEKELVAIDKQIKACEEKSIGGASSCTDALLSVPPGSTSGKSLAASVVDLINEQDFKNDLLDQLTRLLDPDPEEPPLLDPQGNPITNIKKLKEDFKKKIEAILFLKCPPLEYKDEAGNMATASQLEPSREDHTPIINDNDIMIICVDKKPDHLGITANIMMRQAYNPDDPINCFGKLIAEILNATIICKEEIGGGQGKSVFHDLIKYFIDKAVGKGADSTNPGWDGKSRLGPRHLPGAGLPGEGPYYYPPPNDYQVAGGDISSPCPNNCGGALGSDLPMSARFSFLRRMYFEMNAIETYLGNIQALANYSVGALQKLVEGLLYCGDPSKYRHHANGDPMDYVSTLIKDGKYKNTVWDKDYDPDIVTNPDGRKVTIKERIKIINARTQQTSTKEKRTLINDMLSKFDNDKFVQTILSEDQSCKCQSAKDVKDTDTSNENQQDVNTNDDLIPVRPLVEDLTEVQRKIKESIARLKQKLGRDPSLEEVQDDLQDQGITREKILEEIDNWTDTVRPSEPPPVVSNPPKPPAPSRPNAQADLEEFFVKEQDFIRKSPLLETNVDDPESKMIVDILDVIKNPFNTNEPFDQRTEGVREYIKGQKHMLDDIIISGSPPGITDRREAIGESLRRIEEALQLALGQYRINPQQ